MPDMAKEWRPSRTISKLSQLTWREWTDLFRAVLALGQARLRLPSLEAAQLMQIQIAPEKSAQSVSPNAQLADSIARVTWATPKAARIVPWRSDCLVQARAAQSWLKQNGIQSEIKLGARKLPNGQMEAHAWLVCEGEIVTGGDITSFVPFR
jgi:hypothetical protein